RFVKRSNEGDPKGFFREPSSMLAKESCKQSPESAEKTFRVWNMEGEIDRLVYGLYGLAEEEIGIVKGEK
ncbi:MAG: hypothetical protein Q7U68_06480, partial [Candidatus Roizmanbacteria bacterium]|nr:hypothetical protein [Candidatus Roizmanbacteria bacterium]